MKQYLNQRTYNNEEKHTPQQSLESNEESSAIAQENTIGQNHGISKMINSSIREDEEITFNQKSRSSYESPEKSSERKSPIKSHIVIQENSSPHQRSTEKSIKK